MNKYISDVNTITNLGSATVKMLHEVGINSYDDLKKAGPVEVYLRIQRRNIHVSKVMLYALQGALQDTHWNELDPKLKQQLLDDASAAIAESPQS